MNICLSCCHGHDRSSLTTLTFASFRSDLKLKTVLMNSVTSYQINSSGSITSCPNDSYQNDSKCIRYHIIYKVDCIESWSVRRVSSCLQNIADVEVLNQNQKHLRNRNECFELGKPLGQYVRTTGIHPIRTGKNCARETGLLRTDISTFKAQDKKIDSENIDALISFGCSSLHCGYFSIG